MGGIWSDDGGQSAPSPEQGQQQADYQENYQPMPAVRAPAPLGVDYYRESQVKAYHDEMLEIKGLLEGKVLTITEDGEKWDYPVEYERNPQTGEILVDKNGQLKKRIIVKPFCNLDGQKSILAFASLRLRPGTILSNYSIDTVLSRCEDDSYKLALELKLNLRRWEIDATKWEEVHFTIIDRIETARRRAVNNEERKLTSPNMSMTTIRQDNGGQQRIGFVSSLTSGLGAPPRRGI